MSVFNLIGIREIKYCGQISGYFIFLIQYSHEEGTLKMDMFFFVNLSWKLAQEPNVLS